MIELIALAVVAVAGGTWLDNRLGDDTPWQRFRRWLSEPPRQAYRAARTAGAQAVRDTRAQQVAVMATADPPPPPRTGGRGRRAQGGGTAVADPPAQTTAWVDDTRSGRAAVRTVRRGHTAGRGTGRWTAVGWEATRAAVAAVPQGWRDGRETRRRIRPPAEPTAPAQSAPDPAGTPAGGPAAPDPNPGAAGQPTAGRPTEGAPGMAPVSTEIAGVKLPTEITDHATLIRTQNQLTSALNDGASSVMGDIKQLREKLAQLRALLMQVASMPDRVGPHIAQPTRAHVQRQAEQAKRGADNARSAMEDLNTLDKAMKPLAESAAIAEKTAVEAKGD